MEATFLLVGKYHQITSLDIHTLVRGGGGFARRTLCDREQQIGGGNCDVPRPAGHLTPVLLVKL